MLIIFNLSGLLIGLLGAFVGVLTAGLTGSLAAGVLALSAIWASVGLWWRKGRKADGGQRRYPSIFFIPLPFLAIATAILALINIPIELRTTSRTPDPRQPAFTQAEANLRSPSVSGDIDLATSVHNAVSNGAFVGMIAERTYVHAAASDTGVLILVKISNLKKFPNPARSAMLQTVADTVKNTPSLATKPLYIGIKGTLMYGAIQTPSESKVGTDDHQALLAFYGDKPAEATAPPGNP